MSKKNSLIYRIEHDSMGQVNVPVGAYYGAQTQRAIENFQISGLKFHSNFIKAFSLIKLSAAKVNVDLKLLDKKKGKAIIQASKEILDGKMSDQFVLDIFQTGSGTSTNMNVNEVIYNRAIEILGGKKGDKKIIHPNDDVNMGQSTNDVFPTAINIAALSSIKKELIPSLKNLENSFKKKVFEFEDVVKAARTHFQDAVPITLGQEFSGYTSMITHGIKRIKNICSSLSEVPIGGTASGTGLNAHPKFSKLIITEINRLSELKIRQADNTFEAMQSRDSNVEASSAMKIVAVSLIKIANDLRILYSGPRTGLYEIELPAIQPGSSIMPGKVNPVIPEAINMVAAKVIGNDLTISLAGQMGNLDLNTMMPVIAYCLLESITIMAKANKSLAKCVDGIKPNRERCLSYAENTVGLITVLSPIIGYDNAAKIAKKSMKTGKTIKELVIKEKLLPKEKVDIILNLKKLTRGGII